MTISYGYVAIDTNVFEHLLTRENTRGHITTLLAAAKGKASLVVDDKRRIEKEYKNRLLERIKGVSRQKTGKHLGKAPDRVRETSLLRFWIVETIHTRVRVAVDPGDSLMQQITRKLQHPPEGSRNTDRILVYVAFRQGCPLVSNDGGITKKRGALLKIKDAKKGSAILTSKQAAAYIQACSKGGAA